MSYNRAKMKQEVKQIMKQTRPRPIWLALLYLVIVAAGSWVIQSVLGGLIGVSTLSGLITHSFTSVGDIEQAMEKLLAYFLRSPSVISGIITGSILIGVLNYLWSSLMSMGYTGYSIAMARRQNPGAKVLFSAFPKFGKAILTRILVAVFTFLWTLLFMVAFGVLVAIAVLLMESVAFVGVLLFIVAYVGFIVVMFWVTLRYALTDYLVMDQNLSGRQAIRVSKQLMKGNKGRLFVLQLSFIGWYLLAFVVIFVGALLIGLCVIPVASGSVGGILTGVILMLLVVAVMVVGVLLIEMWLLPYMSGSTAKFYEYTMSQRPDLFARQSDSTYTDDSFGNPNYPKLD